MSQIINTTNASSESTNSDLVQAVTTSSLNPIDTFSENSLSQVTISSINKQASDIAQNNVYTPYIFQQLSLQELIIGSEGFVIGESLGVLGGMIIQKYCYHSSNPSSGIEMVVVMTPMLATEVI